MTDWTIADLAAAVRARQVSAEQVTRDLLEQIEARNAMLRAFITVDAEGALREARACDRELQAGRLRGPLHGVPLAHKDLCHVPGLPTSCGTKTPDYFSSERECTATARLRESGALMLGKLNMAELAMGPFGDNAHHGDCQNPWRLGHVTGGSSSGSGCAVAAGLALGALGSDTGGSIRLPAACCGVVGLKPTWGRVSRAGAMALSWSMDHLGPLTRTVRDAGLMLQAIAGHDRYDATTSHRPVPDYLGGLEAGIEGLRLGVPTDFFWEDLAPEIERGVHDALETLRGLGARTVEIGLPESAQLSDLSNVVARAESAAIHQRVAKERPEDLQPAVRTRLLVGYGISAVDYLQAQRLRAKLTRDIVRRVFGQVDALVAPVIPQPAPPLEEVKSGDGEAIAERMGRFSRLTRPFNALGLPAMSVPAGFSGEGLPLAFQVVGRPFAEALVLRIGQAYESATDWQTRRPQG
jgi:aspartyl-tRNA(Asn)/glutamyl-tRNA(Gln) amidotransferase subunit A